MRLIRYIACYEKHGDEFVERRILSRFPLEKIKSWFDTEGDPRMFACYQIDETVRESVENLTGVKIDLSMYDCFLECGTTDDESIPGEPLGRLDDETGYPPPFDPPDWIDGATQVKPKTPA